MACSTMSILRSTITFVTSSAQTTVSIKALPVSAEFTFRGEAAHAAVSPWKGRDALDAVVLMDVGLAQYREHMKPTMTAPSRDHERWRTAERHSGAGGMLVVFSRSDGRWGAKRCLSARRRSHRAPP